MNKAAVQELIDFMERSPYDFEMGDDEPAVDEDGGCGSAGCIIGHARLLWPHSETGLVSVIDAVQHKLDLNFYMFSRLYTPSRNLDGVSYIDGSIDKDWAIRTLEHLLATGEVDWMATREQKL